MQTEIMIERYKQIIAQLNFNLIYLISEIHHYRKEKRESFLIEFAKQELDIVSSKKEMYEKFLLDFQKLNYF